MIAKAAFHIGRAFGYETSLTRDGPLFQNKWIEWERHEGNYFHLWSSATSWSPHRSLSPPPPPTSLSSA